MNRPEPSPAVSLQVSINLFLSPSLVPCARACASACGLASRSSTPVAYHGVEPLSSRSPMDWETGSQELALLEGRLLS
jgi:hypothetical protein